MAIEFREHQGLARRNTTLLVVLMTLAVAATIAEVYLLFNVVVNLADYEIHRPLKDASDRTKVVYPPHGEEIKEESPRRVWITWNPGMALWLTLGTGGLMLMVMLLRMNDFSKGGEKVARMLGGRPIPTYTAEPKMRRLINIVDEMAIASGIPAPPVFLIPGQGINAFAAGSTIENSVVAVTEGALNKFNRDEMQGVIAHEFSHILSGDARLKLRLVGIVAGIVLLAIIGRSIVGFMMHTSAAGSRNGSSGRGGGGGLIIAILLIGGALWLIGIIGAFFAGLIKAAVSRQREFHADATAVALTRNPNGIASALKKIQANAYGGDMGTVEAAEFNHMYFVSGISGLFGEIFATHPNIGIRIFRIETGKKELDRGKRAMGEFAQSAGAAVMGLTSGAGEASLAGFAPSMQTDYSAQSLQVGIDCQAKPQREHLYQAEKLITQIPKPIKLASQDSLDATALIYGMLMDADPAVQTEQFDYLKKHIPIVVLSVRKLLPEIQRLAPLLYLPTLDLSMPSLRRLSESQYVHFMKAVEAMIRADRKLSFFEWVLHRILKRRLAGYFGEDVHVRPGKLLLTHPALKTASERLISALAYVGSRDDQDIQQAFAKGDEFIRDVKLSLLPPEECGLTLVGQAIDELQQARMDERRRLLRAGAAVIATDGRVTAREAELFRALADSLNCPLPPILAEPN